MEDTRADMEDDDSDYRYDCCMNGDVEGFPPQLPKPAKSGAFSYDDRNGLRVGEFSRAPVEELRLLFRKNASHARRRVATKQWIVAQLHLYDIPFNKSAKVGELRDTLEAAVKSRRCVDGEPPSVKLVRERLAVQFARNREDHCRAVKEHKGAVDQWHKQNFSKLNDPSAEARYDLDCFFSKYFVNDKGLPAPSKTPQPVVIWDIREKAQLLSDRVEAIAGLRARVTVYLTVIAWASEFEKGVDTAFAMINSPDIKADRPTLEAFFDPDRFLAKYFLDGLRGGPLPGKQENPLVLKSYFTWNVLEKLSQAAKHVPELLIQETRKPVRGSRGESCVIVGWAEKVIPQVESWKSEIVELKALEIKQKKRNEEKELLARLKPHIDYARAHRPPPSGPFTLSHLVGSYLMQCRKLEDDYGAVLGTMTLDIHAPTSTHGTVAAFNFGVIEGTMLLASSEESLERLRQEQAVRSSDEEEELTDSEYHSGWGKRKATTSKQADAKHFKRRLGTGSTQVPGRFYLQWAGCETGNAYLVLDEDHERTGHFDLDKTGMTARGQMFCRVFFSDKPIVFTLLKIADEPKKEPDAWSSYCEEERWQNW
ncbi:hypothetical protein F5Y07DRAFT_373686 [Xylaria sp. FL0933]|nr:hypothetical protein F5Y07DRAFT_373686 [Xylaria sp. FL0933]